MIGSCKYEVLGRLLVCTLSWNIPIPSSCAFFCTSCRDDVDDDGGTRDIWCIAVTERLFLSLNSCAPSISWREGRHFYLKSEPLQNCDVKKQGGIPPAIRKRTTMTNTGTPDRILYPGLHE